MPESRMTLASAEKTNGDSGISNVVVSFSSGGPNPSSLLG
jgi:hypothetical protein